MEKITFPINSSAYLVDVKSCLSYVLDSLAQIGFPTGLNVISGISYFAEGMDNREDDTSAEPLNQSYLRYSTFLDDSNVSANCLSVLTDIVKGFGARLFQADGKWYIITPNEFAQDEYYYTEYNASGTVVSSGTKSFTGNIEAFNGNTSGLYFVDNSQVKILRKGYNKIKYTKRIDYLNNYITNSTLKNFTGNDAYSWTETIVGSALIKLKAYEKTVNNSFVLFNGGSSQPATVSPNPLPDINSNDVLTFSFDFSNIVVNASQTKMAKVLIKITNGTTIYYLNSNKSWVGVYSTYDIAYDGGVFPTQAPAQTKSVNIEMPPAPQSGSFSLSIINDSDCINWVEISNFQLDTTQLFKSITIESFINDSEEYVYTPDINIGINYTVDGTYYYRGALSDADGVILNNWYRQEYPLDIKNSLIELVISQYSSILENNIINIDSTFFGVQNNTGRLSAAMRITSDDTDVVNSVQGKKYMLGNSTINFAASEVQSTLLEINDNNASTTMTVYYEDTNPLRVWGRKRSNGETTSAGAIAAPLTSNLIYQSGAHFYIDRNLSIRFNGANLYYKVLGENTEETRIYHIDPTGKIIAFEPR